MWYSINILLTLSGLIMLFTQSRCRFKIVRDPTLAALLLDTSDLIRQDDKGVCNATQLEPDDQAERRRLIIPDEDSPSYKHPYLKAGEESGIEKQSLVSGLYARISTSDG